MNRLPDFLFLGTAKAGTTSLFYMLRQHPQIFMPSIKETFFFAYEGTNVNDFKGVGPRGFTNPLRTPKLDGYMNLFAEAGSDSLCGEAGTMFLYTPIAAEKIKHYIPQAKLIVILRNPADRAYSHYQFNKRDGEEPLKTFEEAMLAEEDRIKENWFPGYYYVDLGFYARQLKRYYQLFSPEQIKVYLYEDLSDPQSLLNDLFNFLGLNQLSEINTNVAVNISGKPRLTTLYQAIKTDSKMKLWIKNQFNPTAWGNLRSVYEKLMIQKPKGLQPATRQKLINIYRNDIVELQTLIQRDLSEWLI